MANVSTSEERTSDHTPVPPPPAPVAAAFESFPAPVRDQLLALRRLIFETAGETDGVGPLEEALKWGEPAYLTAATRSGSTIRLGWSRRAPDHCKLLFHCQTTLVESFRAQFGDDLAYEGNRAILLAPSVPLPRDTLATCIAAALTYHRTKGG